MQTCTMILIRRCYDFSQSDDEIQADLPIQGSLGIAFILHEHHLFSTGFRWKFPTDGFATKTILQLNVVIPYRI